MSKQTKQQKIERLQRLIREVHGEGEQWDLSKTYEITTYLAGSMWYELLAPIDQNLEALQCLTSLWFEDGEDAYADAHGWLKSDEHASDDYCVEGSVVVRLLDDLKKELGPHPERSKVLWNQAESTYGVAKIRDTTHAELDRTIELMKKETQEALVIEEEKKENQRHDHQVLLLVQTAKKLGLEEALAVLHRELPSSGK